MRSSFIFSEVFNGFRRNITMTVAMILTTAITLGMFGAGLLVVQMADKSQKIFLSRVEMQVFLKMDVSLKDPDCRSQDCTALQSKLESMPGVTRVEYISPAEALNDAKTRTFVNQPEMRDLLTPDTFPGSFRVRAKSADDFGPLVDQLQPDKQANPAQPFAAGDPRNAIDQVLDQRDLVKRIFSVLDGVRNAAFTIALILAVAAVLLIANTVQVAAYTRRTEVGIMRLVGATRWYTQLPFLLEAVFASVIGSILAIAGLFTAKTVLFDNALKDLYGINILAKISDTDVLFVSPWLVIVGAALAAVTGYVTLRVYVRN
jgi:cell division transport system permease protein